jgi:D-3-phosphoglycerate dehydrogenase
MQKEKVLVTDRTHPLLVHGLRDLGFEVDDRPEITLAEVREIIGSYVGLVINSKIRVDKSMLVTANQLRFVARLGSGLEIIDLPAAAAQGIVVFSAPEGNCNAVAEHALGMLLCLANHLLQADRQVRKFLWHRESNRGWELAGRTVGIIGVGHTGSAFATKLQGCGVKILGHDKYADGWKTHLPWVTSASKEEVMAQADIISLHLPLTPETRHYIDQSVLQNCRPGVILINTARGNQVNTRHLIAALEAGHVGGACLDVFEHEHPDTLTVEEKADYARLYTMDNVVLSPHVAGWTYESLERIASVLLKKISGWQNEKKLEVKKLTDL